MVTRIGGSRRKTRSKVKKNFRKKGKISIGNYFQIFKEGDKVKLYVEPAIQKGMYCPRFFGKVGEILGKVGKCYKVKIKDFNKTKELIVHPVHLLRQ